MRKQKFLQVDTAVSSPAIITLSDKADKALSDFIAKNPDFSDVRVASIAMNKKTLVLLVNYKDKEEAEKKKDKKS